MEFLKAFCALLRRHTCDTSVEGISDLREVHVPPWYHEPMGNETRFSVTWSPAAIHVFHHVHFIKSRYRDFSGSFLTFKEFLPQGGWQKNTNGFFFSPAVQVSAVSAEQKTRTSDSLSFLMFSVSGVCYTVTQQQVFNDFAFQIWTRKNFFFLILTRKYLNNFSCFTLPRVTDNKYNERLNKWVLHPWTLHSVINSLCSILNYVDICQRRYITRTFSYLIN